MRIGKDKLMHAGMCCLLVIFFAAFRAWDPLRRIIFVTIIIGGAKEIYDMTHEGHDAEWADLVADFIGAVLGELIVACILHW